ncbi:peptide-methionine (S)-S-oxide reductase [Galbibacter orientalis]|uniref:peptide-methionine (S)-S-oxide reductase n=1 Tax=Galbibacter orientalis DSM 19592 TaxID=926559 RepID=I3C3K9_9FLAO|nr:peptide-methionine (S)-S-oxide reductase [Galbibacter orientalis]EIJ38202.1 peptide methionine sulfoxide reductase [Galbibacter orientalis DSM 19592]|tara:strand:+ start:362 stop:865 length:504 start_codon:yes stop_codon:yes gene_type:complete
MNKIALSGSCYWCMEAIYQSLVGVKKVAQGFVASKEYKDQFSEAIIVHFIPDEISLKTLIEIHLHTHKSTVNHSWRDAYKSAIYTFSEEQKDKSMEVLELLQKEFSEEIITKVYSFESFKPSEEMFHNYYFSNPEKPFCKSYINPKLKKLLKEFSEFTNKEKLESTL